MFKKYDQKQQFLLPISLEDFIAEDHISRILNDIIDTINITTLEAKYSKDGCPAYHPRLLIKILLYGYMINIRSSREIHKMTHTDTAFMYLAADNIDLLNQIGTDPYIPDNFFKVEERGKSKYFLKSMFRFDKENDCYCCPAGITMPFKWIQKRDDEPDLKQYIGDHCSICVLKNACTKAKNRIISRDPREHLMEDMRKKLRTEEGKELYQERMSTIEPVFGQMKQNRGFTEFLLRGKDKTKVEFIMMCIVHNIEKIGGFLKRKAKDMKEVLRKGISIDNLENISEIMINCADKISIFG